MLKSLLLTIIFLTPLLSMAEDCTCPCPCDPETPTTYSAEIVINELLPNPSGDEETEEWIELKNTGSSDVDLCSWQLKDASGKTYTLETTTINAGSYLTIYRPVSGIALNNSGTETVELYQPDGNLLYTVSYTDSAQDDYSYARKDDDSWAWSSTPTPNTTNTFIEEPVEETIPAEEEKEIETQYELSDKIIINEIYPNPADSEEEFIELRNTGEQEIDLAGWQISDSTDKKFAITADDFTNTKIEKFFIIKNSISKISLNNSGDTVKLYGPDDVLIESTDYGKAEKGQSYSKKKGSWQWSASPTPNDANEIAEEKSSAETTINYSDKIQITELLPDPEGSDSTDE